MKVTICARVQLVSGLNVVLVVPLVTSSLTAHSTASAYSPTWIDGKKHARNVYAHTREECEEKLKVLIAEMKAELAELKRQKGDRH